MHLFYTVNMVNKYIIGVLILFIYNVPFGQSITKVWKYNTDIYDVQNWINNASKKDCSGIIFSPTNEAPIYIEHVITQQITLPTHGELLFTNKGFIAFKSINLCIKLKEFNYHYWDDIKGWTFDGEDNTAIPHFERIPCKYDDVVFPKGSKSAVEISHLFDPQKINSLKFNKKYLKNDELQSYMSTYEGKLTFFNLYEVTGAVTVEKFVCNDPSGCECGSELLYTCAKVSSENNIKCINPVLPTGFCSEICGAYLLFKPKPRFSIEKIRKLLSNYEVDTYVSKISNEMIQIVFSEKDFNGKSLESAQELHAILNDEIYKNDIKQLELHSSGPYYVEGEMQKITLSLIFGTLFGVVIIFGMLYLFYEPSNGAVNITNRFNIGSRPLSAYKPYLFARYDRDEASLIFGDQSLAGSVTSLEKSFDNPMYGRSSPSTSASYDTISPENKTGKSEIVHENPLYDLKNFSSKLQEDDKNEQEKEE